MGKITIDPSEAFFERTPHPLEPFFHPKSIAVIGATQNSPSVGNTLMQNLISAPFLGKIFPVNPKYTTLFDLPCYPSVRAIGEEIDLAVIITPAKIVPQMIDECVSKNIKAAIIISAGFKELGKEGLELENKVLEKARKGNMRLIGPNCLGIMNPLAQLNATFAASMALKGNIAFISQSGAMCTAVLDWSLKEKIGFSAFVSIGSMADVNWGDLIDYLGSDPHTSSILIYMETIGNAKDFLSAAREVALNKPIIVIKAGRTQAAARAAASHTGSMAGSDDVFDAAMKRAGVLRVFEIGDLFHVAEVLAKQPIPKGPRLTILTNAGGPAVLATDSAVYYGAQITDLAPKTIQELNSFLPAAWSHSNPVDLLGDAGPERYAKAIEVVSKDPNTDGILVILSPQDVTDVIGTAEHLRAYAQISGKPILASWMGGEVVEKGIQLLNEANIPTFQYPDSASKIFAAMWRQAYALQSLYQTPERRQGTDDLRTRIKETELILQKALKEGRVLLTEEESKRVLSSYSIPIVETKIATTPRQAKELANQIGYPVVLKLHSETITHKTDVGGVLLNLKDEESVEKGFEQIQASVSKKVGVEHFLGVTVQKMISREGFEIILGSSLDPQFGPILLFGTGGQLVEVFQDRSLALPPLNAVLAKRMMSETKIFTALQGVRGKKAVDFSKLEQILISFAELIVSHPQIIECDINPLLVSSEQMIALDARIVLSKQPIPHPVIRPYPSEYISHVSLSSGEKILLRPIRAEDEPLFQDFHRELSRESVRARYFEELSFQERIDHERMIRICFTDYDREITLLALHQETIIGVIRLYKIPLSQVATLKMIVVDKMQKKGLGTLLLSNIISIAKREGIHELNLQFLSNNERIKKMLLDKGFTLSKSQKNPDIFNAFLRL